ncbi:MAG: UDP-N-acetylglucosamine 1-carboxyvinyltransferase [Firmicutes bacterium]|nr:UDP-N-acetylglucosamine 1-carboxyvinyltransferase [Bacillota bacterium]
MEIIKVKGGKPLTGRVRISGAKNAALVLMAASVLAHGESVIENVPRIQDVEILISLLQSIGVEVEWRQDSTLAIHVPDNVCQRTPYDLSKRLRASNLLLGSIIGRLGFAEISLPGGCDIGSRPMDLHLKGLQMLGFETQVEHGYILGKAVRPKGSKIYLDFPSVGATENIMMAACVVPGSTIIENVAKEPEIVDLANFLNAMGAKVRGAGTDIIRIEGVPILKGVRYGVIPDRIEAGTYMTAAAISGGDVTLENVIPTHVQPVVAKLRESGAKIVEVDDEIRVTAEQKAVPLDIKTMPYPGFPTDMQSQMMALLSLANGTSVIVENVFENRLQVADELRRMGARIKVEGHTAVVEGVERLYGTCVKATDLRAGAALLVAGLAADGTTEVGHAQHIYRGYENVIEKFTNLGADLEAVEN